VLQLGLLLNDVVESSKGGDDHKCQIALLTLQIPEAFVQGAVVLEGPHLRLGFQVYAHRLALSKHLTFEVAHLVIGYLATFRRIMVHDRPLVGLGLGLQELHGVHAPRSVPRLTHPFALVLHLRCAEGPRVHHHEIGSYLDAKPADGRIVIVLEELKQGHDLGPSDVRRCGCKLDHVGYLSGSILALQKYDCNNLDFKNVMQFYF